jgi:valyl-tRNA synthetase
MDKVFNPSEIEQRWADKWEKDGLYQPQTGQPNYAITLPPPNVTGTLHMGHGFQMTLMDTLIRYHRMRGAKTLWQPGTDHAGIATQMVVERELGRDNITRHDLGREAFIERVWDWKAQSGNIITNQIRRLGASLDWTRERFSMDDTLSKATTEAFIRLYRDGKIYRGKRLVNWDPKLNTAISDLEVVNKESQGSLWHIRYPLSDNSGSVVIATTRPETLLGDTAVAVHPEDERYAELIGKSIRLPLCNRDIPIIADEEVDREFGSGCVKITPAHDFNDYEMGRRHDLPSITIFTFDGHLNDNTPSEYQGLERFAARKKIIADLTEQDCLVKTEPHTLNIPMGDRSGVVIEPMLTDQWFIRMEELAEPAINAVNTGELKFTPANWQKTYCQWLENIQDWCISRQLWWGHRIPAWYDDNGKPYIGYNEADVRSHYQLNDDITLTQDNDVLDTWFTAALCPFSSLGWPEKTPDLADFYPNNVLVTGFDIIFFWVARMVMMGLYFCQQVPFKEVYIHGLIRDSQGQKMSKSKGNVLDPIDLVDGIALEPLIEKRTFGLMQPKMAEKVAKQTRKEFPAGINPHGTDALRFTYCALASTGRDINFDMGRIEGYRNFCNKIWNATRFILMQTEEIDITPCEFVNVADQWVVSELNKLTKLTEQHLSNYRFDLLASCLYEFTWNEFCDWYLELAKSQLNNPDSTTEQKASSCYTLISCLEKLLRLMHPIMPFITAEIHQTISAKMGLSEQDIMTCPYPEYQAELDNIAATEQVAWLKELVNGIRNIRGEIGVSPAKQAPLICISTDQKDPQRLEQWQTALEALAKVESITWQQDRTQLPPAATTLIKQLEIHIPLADLIDKEQELNRLTKEINKLEKEYQASKQRLENENYVKKAPAAVVEKEQQKCQQAQEKLAKLKSKQEEIKAL